MRRSIIVAMAANRVIGRDDQIPWRCSADLKRFKSLTMGHDLIMGRRTFESIGRPLPGRRTIVVSRRLPLGTPGVDVARTLSEAMALARGPEVFLAGGQEIYRAALEFAERIYLTRIEAEVDGNVHFPEFDEPAWTLALDEPHLASDGCDFDFRFQVYDRLARPGGHGSGGGD